ncbi:hypothetical protein DPEC_G00020810 [Dallia pectoralis]|uniref:Uncharacterized protein n=1 Tax=Dallia pectoralis TaxID=75939 RepID=A0ACC2HFX6_DALPE|nr:hypothetical protein DPEC_G00020810 [Dallia pectoralis]
MDAALSHVQALGLVLQGVWGDELMFPRILLSVSDKWAFGHPGNLGIARIRPARLVFGQRPIDSTCNYCTCACAREMRPGCVFRRPVGTPAESGLGKQVETLVEALPGGHCGGEGGGGLGGYTAKSPSVELDRDARQLVPRQRPVFALLYCQGSPG